MKKGNEELMKTIGNLKEARVKKCMEMPLTQNIFTLDDVHYYLNIFPSHNGDFFFCSCGYRNHADFSASYEIFNRVGGNWIG